MVSYFPHTLIAFGGTIVQGGANADIWSSSIRGGVSGGTFGPVSDPAGMLTAAKTTLSTWFSTSGNLLNPLCGLTWLKINNIGSDGHYSGGATNVWNYPSPIYGFGTATTSDMPPFVTCVVTNLTTVPRGKTSRGRISLPFRVSSSAAGQATISSTNQTTYGRVVKDLYSLLAAAGTSAGSSWQPRVYSSINGAYSNVNSVRVGQRMDTLNRRKNAIPEAPYVTQAWP